MNILGSNFLLSNPIKGVGDPSAGYVNSNSIADVQSRVHSDGALYQMNNGVGTDTFTFNSGNGNALFATDSGDTVTLHGNWSDSKQYVQDDKTQIWGELYTDKDTGEKVIVSGGGTVKTDNTPTPNQDGMTQDKVKNGITTIEDGKNVDGLVTKDEIKAALDGGKFTGDEKSFWQQVYDNFDNGFDTSKDGRVGGDHLINADDVNYHGAIK